MQAITEDEMEKWHDYEVSSYREIVALLRQSEEKNSIVRLLIRGESDVCMTSLVHIDTDSDTLILDCSIDREQNQRILVASKVTCETTLDKIRILFQLDGLRAIDWKGGGGLRAAIPRTLVRLQRREYYRMPTPVAIPVRVTIPLPTEAGGGSAVFPLADIGCGGLAIVDVDNKYQLSRALGVHYPNCCIEFPEIRPVAVTLQIRNSQEVELLNHKTNHRLGCQFIDISRSNLAIVQRYITKRERNARLAGLV